MTSFHKKYACQFLKAIFIAIALTTISLSASATKRRWPDRVRYRQAMKNLAQHTVASSLHGVSVDANAKQEPLMWPGANYTVFRIKDKSGQPLALRVIHEGSNLLVMGDDYIRSSLASRYAALSKYLAALQQQDRLPLEISEFHYEPEGLNIDGHILPVMTMPWAEGTSLDKWITTQIAQGNTEILADLADDFRAALSDCNTVEIHHGDLHHGNIRVAPDGAMQFVDPDALWVPALANMKNAEIGSLNFQHPAHHDPNRRIPRPSMNTSKTSPNS